MGSSDPRGAAQHYRELVEINRLITSSLDRDVVLTTVTEQAARLLQGDAAALLLNEAGALKIAASHNIRAPATEFRMPVEPGMMAAIRELGSAEGLGGYVGVPLVLRGEAIGILAVYRRELVAPTGQDEELLSALADQAAIALENARIYRQSQAQAAAIRESEERFRLALDEAPIGVALVGLDGRFLRVNNALCEIVGYSAEELTSLTFQAITHPDDVAADVRLAQQLASGEVARYQLAKRYIRKDGTPVEVVLSASMVRRPGGAPLYYISHVEDVTERKLAERELAKLLRRLQVVLEEAPVGILMTHDGRTWQANGRAQEMFGRTLDVDDPAPYLDAILDADERSLPHEQLPGARALRGEKLEGIEMRLHRPDGRMVPVLVNAAPIPPDETELPGAVVAFEDISSLKELERLRSEWSSIVAHDLREPLSSIAMSAELVAEQATGDLALQRRIQQIRNGARRLGRMIGDLLDVSRLEARQLRLDLERVELSGLVAEVSERVGLGAPDRRFEVQVHGAPAFVEVDPDRFEQIMENLLTNAIKYGAPGTPILVEVRPAGGGFEVAVTNHGAGIRPEQVPHLFQRFHTIEEARRLGIHGIGLGLYITRALVEAHGGKITVDSSPGGATTFRFTLPAAPRVVAADEMRR